MEYKQRLAVPEALLEKVVRVATRSGRAVAKDADENLKVCSTADLIEALPTCPRLLTGKPKAHIVSRKRYVYRMDAEDRDRS